MGLVFIRKDNDVWQDLPEVLKGKCTVKLINIASGVVYRVKGYTPETGRIVLLNTSGVEIESVITPREKTQYRIEYK